MRRCASVTAQSQLLTVTGMTQFLPRRAAKQEPIAQPARALAQLGGGRFVTTTGTQLNQVFSSIQAQLSHEFLVRYRWNEGDLGFWDNRSTMHYAVSDYGEAHRVIQRVTIQGDRPY